MLENLSIGGLGDSLEFEQGKIGVKTLTREFFKN
jgi:hypothetical protein